MIKKPFAILVLFAITGGIVWMADNLALDPSRHAANDATVGHGAAGAPTRVTTSTATPVMSGFTINGGTPLPTEWIAGVVDSPPPPIPPPTWSEADALEYAMASLTAFIPEFSWERAAARKLTGYQGTALEHGWELDSLPTLEPDSDPVLEYHYKSASWWIVFELPKPMRYSDFAKVLGADLGLNEAEDELYFTQGLMILQEESGAYTGTRALDSVDDQGESSPEPMRAWTFDDFVDIPTTSP